MKLTKKKKAGLLSLLVIILGFLIPQNFSMPVEGASKSDYHPQSFWYYPWGKSVTHKGVDIFAKKGVNVRSTTIGLVLYTGNIEMGGKVALVLGPKWRLHYYAHMDKVLTSSMSWASEGELIGTVGDSGNANGKQPHLHYSIMTLLPYFWQIDGDKQGWKKMFYLNPIKYMEAED